MWKIQILEDSNKYGPFDSIVFCSNDYEAAVNMLAKVRRAVRARIIWN